jgi:hypothetical protein
MGPEKDLDRLEAEPQPLELKISVHSRMRKSFLDDMDVSGMAKKMIWWKHEQHQQHFRPAHLPPHLIVSQEEVVNLSSICMVSCPAVASYLNPTSQNRAYRLGTVATPQCQAPQSLRCFFQAMDTVHRLINHRGCQMGGVNIRECILKGRDHLSTLS